MRCGGLPKCEAHDGTLCASVLPGRCRGAICVSAWVLAKPMFLTFRTRGRRGGKGVSIRIRFTSPSYCFGDKES